MPELPEVETMVRGIRPHVAGRKIVAVRKGPSRCRPMSIMPRLATLSQRVTGQTITAVRRLAKRVVLDVTDGSNLVIEPRMTGLVLLSDPPDREHLRVEWELDGDSPYRSLWFWDQRGLGTLRWYAPGELASALLSGKLGPDALTVSTDDWLRICRRTSRPIKVALLDQKLVAGIGNLYASEILHAAGIAPQKPADRLRTDDIARLHTATMSVLETAILYEGSTLGDGTYRNALNQTGRYQNAHRVYDRAGKVCPTCNAGVVARIVQAQRSTFFCATCQPHKRRRH
ncbi:MAG: bifunctional DNA-formamidopyrimidine glycosylase/DNA-(apurinic or apyrimidinic site) lyase [Planctomycetaceae bacterium]|nr:bifunctional DNA-formamidopyrimidine glycosylase/DNA-(apurinic or apyrimidinic site) lyase [Planctomycetaceae bacterium]